MRGSFLPNLFVIFLSCCILGRNVQSQGKARAYEGSKTAFVEGKSVQIPSPDEQARTNGPTIIVSTLDGKVSALDVNDGGNLIWSIDSGPLVSSSISKLQIIQDGKVVRLIPSLSGKLYKFDGHSVEALPFSAEQLLSSSFKISEDLLLVGGKDITAFALDSTTGQILYLCYSTGCQTVRESTPGTNVLIVKRHQQTVRSLDSRNGSEKWNFTVGEIELDIAKGEVPHMLEYSGDGDGHANAAFTSFKHYKNTHTSDKNYNCDEKDINAASSFLQKIQVRVPEGVFCVFGSQQKTNLIWKHKFESPIANAWYLYRGVHHEIDLFDPNTVPELKEKHGKQVQLDIPTIYLGFYHTQAYIQASSFLPQTMETKQNQLAQSSQSLYPPTPRLRFYEFFAKAIAPDTKDGGVAVYKKPEAEQSSGNVPATRTGDIRLQKDTGFYFKHDQPYWALPQGSKKRGRGTVEDDGDGFGFYNTEIVYSSFMHWWKEILIICVTTSIFVQFLILKCMHFFKGGGDDVFTTASASAYVDAGDAVPNNKHDRQTSFESRYLQDFEPVQCLGKGGFGIVIESRNKVDDCSYAVKRIRLPKKPAAREKVMREVRALATMEHPCIVRYFNAWTEEPPAGWQEQKDQELISDASMCSTQTQWHGHDNQMEVHGDHETFFECSNDPPSKKMPFSRSDILAAKEVEESGSFSVHFDESIHPTSGTSRKDISGNWAKKFWNDDSSEEEDSDEKGGTEQTSIPLSRYVYGDSSGVVFGNSESGDIRITNSLDSAIDTSMLEKSASPQTPPNEPFSPASTGNQGRPTDINSIRRRPNSSRVDLGVDDSDVQSKNDNETTNVKEKDTKIHSTLFLYIQMQLCQKESLRTWLANREDRSHDYCLGIFQQVTSAVRYVHDRNLIHRDLKPSNIFFSFDGSVKVGDFGLVTETDEQPLDGNAGMHMAPSRSAPSGLHTEHVGTRLYMAPEQMAGRSYNQKVDIFALGIILIELLVPFGTQMERVSELTNARRCNISRFFSKQYPNETVLVKGMLSSAPTKRPAASDILAHPVVSRLDAEKLLHCINKET